MTMHHKYICFPSQPSYASHHNHHMLPITTINTYIHSWTYHINHRMHLGYFKITCNAFGNCTSLANYYNDCKTTSDRASSDDTTMVEGTPPCTDTHYDNIITPDGQHICSASLCHDKRVSQRASTPRGCVCTWKCKVVPGTWAFKIPCWKPDAGWPSSQLCLLHDVNYEGHIAQQPNDDDPIRSIPTSSSSLMLQLAVGCPDFGDRINHGNQIKTRICTRNYQFCNCTTSVDNTNCVEWHNDETEKEIADAFKDAFGRRLAYYKNGPRT